MILNANALQLPLATDSAQMCVTSPPYWGLRDYGVSDQLGLEKTPDCLGWATGHPCGVCYVCHMVAVFREVKRVLRDDGVLFLNLGDSYWGGKGKSGYEMPHEAEARRDLGKTFQTAHNIPGYMDMRPSDGKSDIFKPKDLIGIPWRVALALQADGWYLRSDIIWAKPNPMPESVKDRPTKSHEYIFLLAKSARYFWDQEAVKEEAVNGDPRQPLGSEAVLGQPNEKRRKQDKVGKRQYTGFNERWNSRDEPLTQRNLRTVWTIATQPIKEAHFATYPEKLAETCIKAGSKPGDIVLDPFTGSGTSERVAIRLNRRFIGTELKFDYIANIAKTRTQNIQRELTRG